MCGEVLSPVLTELRTPGNLAGTMQSSKPYVLGPGKGRFIDLGDFSMTVKATEGDTGGLVSVLEAEEPPGFGPPLHVHHDCAEAFYVLDGEYIMVVDDREVVVRPARSSSFRGVPVMGFGSGTFRAGN